MTNASASTPLPTPVDASNDPAAEIKGNLPDGYEAIRANTDTQFEPIQLKKVEPRKPSEFEQSLNDFFEWLADLFAPIGQALTANWFWLQWALMVLLAALVVLLLARLIGPLAQRQTSQNSDEFVEPEWQPDREESLALLEDADRLAGQGRFEEAARLLLKRSIGQIAAARPQWVDPSSTARELAALPRLSESARGAFGVISEAVERSLFALQSLTREDWDRARAAYADFALARIDAGKSPGKPQAQVDRVSAV